MRERNLLFFIFVGLLLSGCITGTHSYIQPAAPKIENSLVINNSQDEVFAGFLAKGKKGVFVIDSTDQSAGLIRLSYNGDPEQFVDCGIVQMTAKDIHGERSYVFPSARKEMTFESTDKGNLYNIRRKMDLETKVNVVFKELSATSTQVSVDCKYILTKNSEIRLVGGSVLESAPINVIDSVSFHTGGRGTFTNSTGTCNPTYALERQVLSFAQ